MKLEGRTIQKLWTRQYILVLLVSLLLSIAFNMQNNILPLYALDISGSISVASLMTGLFSVTALVFRPMFGNMLDNLGRKLVLVGGILTFTLVSFSYSFAYIALVLLAIRVIQGACFSAYSTASGTVVADIIPSERLMEGIGYYGIAGTIASAVGPALGLYLVKHASYSMVFILSTILAAGSFGLAMLIKYKQKGCSENKSVLKPINNRTKVAIVEKTAVPTSLTMFFIIISSGCILTFLPAYAKTRGIDNIGIYYTINAVALLMTRLFMGRVADRYGYSKVIVPSMLLCAISLVILSQATTLFAFLIAGFLNGLALGILMPMLNSFIIKLSPIERRGIANATYFSSLDIGITVGALAGGIISKHFGYPALFLSAAGCIAFALAEYYFVLRLQLKEQNRAVEIAGGIEAQLN